MTRQLCPFRTHRSRLSGASLRSGILSVAAFSCIAVSTFAQIPLISDPTAKAAEGTPPAYEVTSVKENKGGDNNIRIMMKPNGFSATNIALKDLVTQAYGIRQDLVSGLPDWVNNTRYDVDAKVADEDVAALKTLNQRQRAGMLVAVLTDRFHLQSHTEVRTLPTYDLVVDKGGPKLTESAPAPPTPSTPGDAADKKPMNRFTMGPGRISVNGYPLASLLNQLAYTVHRTVVDKTGLTGKYDIDLKWTPEEKLAASSDSGTDDPAGSIFTALREQLGLRLVSSKGPVETLVVDHVEKPSAN